MSNLKWCQCNCHCQLPVCPLLNEVCFNSRTSLTPSSGFPTQQWGRRPWVCPFNHRIFVSPNEQLFLGGVLTLFFLSFLAEMNIFLVLSYNSLTSSGSVFSIIIQTIIIPPQRGLRQRFYVYHIVDFLAQFFTPSAERAQRPRHLTTPPLRKIVNGPLRPRLPETGKN